MYTVRGYWCIDAFNGGSCNFIVKSTGGCAMESWIVKVIMELALTAIGMLFGFIAGERRTVYGKVACALVPVLCMIGMIAIVIPILLR